MGNIINYNLNQKPKSWTYWLKLTENQRIDEYSNLIRPSIKHENDRITFDTFTNYIKFLINDYESRLEWNFKYSKNFSHNQKIDDQTIEALKLIISKLNIQLDLKQLEIDLKDKNISKNQYNIKKELKKRISSLDNKLKSHPRKIRRLTINHKKEINDFENSFKIKKPEFYYKIKKFEDSQSI